MSGLARDGVVRVAAGGVLAARAGAAGAPPDSARRGGSAADTTRRSGAPPCSASADSLPSDDAKEVLKTLPEPLPPGEQVPPASAAAVSSAASDSAADSSAGVDAGSTAPLGEAPGSPRRCLPAYDVLNETCTKYCSARAQGSRRLPPPPLPRQASLSRARPPSSLLVLTSSAARSVQRCWRFAFAC